jgi:UDP-glucose 4-epimerase
MLMKVLVLGGAGYIGSVCAAQLLQAGHQVAIVDDLSKGHRGSVPDGAELHVFDIRDEDVLAAVLDDGVEAVMHFAARSLVGESTQDPVGYFASNVGGAVSALGAMRRAGVRRLVFSSTAATYGEPVRSPITEHDPTVPTNPYGATKLAIDQMIGFEAAANGLGAVSLRYFNVAGASGRFGELHDPETHLIPLVLAAAADPSRSIKVFGTDYPTPDGTAIRDYIHVEDIARAHLLALEGTDAPGHRIYNLGNGEGYSVRQVLDVAREVTGRDFAVEETGRRAGDPAVLVASSARARADLGWTPAKPSLAAMVEDAWRFVTEHAGPA